MLITNGYDDFDDRYNNINNNKHDIEIENKFNNKVRDISSNKNNQWLNQADTTTTTHQNSSYPKLASSNNININSYDYDQTAEYDFKDQFNKFAQIK